MVLQPPDICREKSIQAQTLLSSTPRLPVPAAGTTPPQAHLNPCFSLPPAEAPPRSPPLASLPAPGWKRHFSFQDSAPEVSRSAST